MSCTRCVFEWLYTIVFYVTCFGNSSIPSRRGVRPLVLPMSTEEDNADAAIRLTDYLILIGLVTLYWDHLLTFGDEVRWLWTASMTKGVWCFFINRYVACFANIPIWFVTLHNYEREICMAFGVYRSALYGFTQVFVGSLLGIRVYALYGCNRRLGVFLVIFLIGLMALAGWSMGTPSTPYDGKDCTFSLSESGGIRVAIAWECVLAWDIVIIALILWRSYRALHFGGRRIQVPLIALITRDGVTYFIVMSLANAANILTFYLASPRVKGSLSGFASSVSVSMMSRLIINLHKDTSHLFDATGPRSALVFGWGSRNWSSGMTSLSEQGASSRTQGSSTLPDVELSQHEPNRGLIFE